MTPVQKGREPAQDGVCWPIPYHYPLVIARGRIVECAALLYVAAFLAFAIGVAHSYLGERAILIRLLRRDNLPRLFGGDWFTKRTLRFAWHATTLAWWGLGLVLLAVEARPETGLRDLVLLAVAVTFAASAVIAGVASHGRHLSWIVFLAIAVLSWLAMG